MKILIISPTLNYGGAERVASLWADGFVDNNHRVLFVTNIRDNQDYQTNSQVVPLTSASGNKVTRYINAIPRVRQYCKEFHPDIIIGVMYVCSFIARISSIRLDIPVVATEHDSFERPISAPLHKVEYFTKFWINKLYDTVTVLTKADKKAIGSRLKNVVVMPNPLSLVPAKSIPVKENVVLAAGRLDAWHYKGFDNLIKAWGTMLKNEETKVQSGGSGINELKEWKLKIAGRGNETNITYLKKICKDYGVEDSVEFLGFVSDMQSLYKKASVFVLSSRYEGFGMVLIEAMSQGCACVACDYNGRQREIIQNDSQGLCCEPDNVQALAKALERMIIDADYRESVRQPAIERSCYYSVQNTIERWENFLNDVTKGLHKR